MQESIRESEFWVKVVGKEDGFYPQSFLRRPRADLE